LRCSITCALPELLRSRHSPAKGVEGEGSNNRLLASLNVDKALISQGFGVLTWSGAAPITPQFCSG
jgi:hypothetical protein